MSPPGVDVVLVGVVDPQGRVLLQERDEHAPVDPDRWTLVGGGVEAGEAAASAARRELVEETGVDCDALVPLSVSTLPCEVHGEDRVALFTVRLELTDADVACHEGRQIVFVDPARAIDLDLTSATRALLPEVLAAHR